MSYLPSFDTAQPLSALQAATRFDAYFDVYGLSLKQTASDIQRTVTLVARSPVSPAAQALVLNLRRFEPGTIAAGIVLAQVGPADALDLLFQTLESAGCGSPETIVRWAKNRALLDAHERLTLGGTLCWTGDSMRRSSDARSGIDRVEDANPAMLAEAHASFAALWKASKPLPKSLLANPAAFQFASDDFARPESATSAGADPNVVRLEDYLRSRRH